MSTTTGDYLPAGSGDGEGDMAVIGEGTPNRKEVSLQVLQDIYHELTGKSEDVSKSYSDPFQIVHENIEQLNHRIVQACEQYNVTANNCSVKIYYINDTQENFSSFERFRHFNAGSSSSVESILITYDFLIILPKLNQPQSYNLSIRIASRIAIEKKMSGEMIFEMPKILRMMGGRTAVVNVKYIDYVVARNLLNVVDEWFKTSPKAATNGWWNAVRKRSRYLPLIARYITGVIVATIIFFELPRFLIPSTTFLSFAQVLLCASLLLFGSYRLAHHLGSSAEDSLDRWSDLSYVSLTAGDKLEIDSAKSRNRSSVVAFVLKFFVSATISVVAKLIIVLIVK